MRGWQFIVLATGALLVAACSDNGTNPVRGAPGLTVTLEGPASDTVMSPRTRIVATMNDSAGRPVSGASVTFRLDTPTQTYVVGVSPITPQVFGLTSLTVTTDTSGHASADLVHEITAGTMPVIVEVPSGAVMLADTIIATTMPGGPSQLLLNPHDTTLYQGGTSVVAASTADRYGNPRPEHPALSAAAGAFTINGTTITATAGPSRQVVHAEYQGLRDSLYVSIVPHGVIAARGAGTFDFTTMELDGSARTVVALQNRSPFTVPESWTEWTADGNGLLYYVTDMDSRDVMYRTGLDGMPTRISVTSPMGSDAWPQTSLDGGWVYFSSLIGSDEGYVYRMHADGSAVERLSLAGGPHVMDIFPSPSPDNTKVVYATTRGGASLYEPRVEVLDIASGTVTSLGTGNMPRWSPDGQWIVLIRGGGLILVHPDGTGERQLSAPAAGYQGELSWSPDSKWIIAPNIGYLSDLFEISTGLRLPLRYSGSFQAIDWRPF
jgi:hypothetical protein